jgi:hypothetical protein
MTATPPTPPATPAADQSAADEATEATPGALRGTALLAKVKEMGEASKSDLVRACGYVSAKKDGAERLNFTAFYEAVLQAKGVTLGEGASSDVSKPGRKLSFTTKVQFNGNLLVGSAYGAIIGLQPGDEFEIKLGRNKIILVRAGSKPEAGEGDSEGGDA